MNTNALGAQDFAGLLAELAAAKPTRLPPWNDEQLPQDVATLSYEHALRTHARYKDADVCNAPARTVKPGPRNECASRPAASAAAGGMLQRKCASITIRMSRAECEQLRERAAEAGMTISAYLRSCTFEAEALRAQVKEALAELRRAPAPKAPVATERTNATSVEAKTESASEPRPGWLRRLIPNLHAARNVARA